MCLANPTPTNGLWYSCPDQCAACEAIIAELTQVEYSIAHAMFPGYGIYFSYADQDLLQRLLPDVNLVSSTIILTAWHSRVNGQFHFLPAPTTSRDLLFFVHQKLFFLYEF